jgi:diguanylate cyclase (GGDEF)-like protein
MFLDLDRFKSINDSLGHAVGNQLLQAVAKRLRSTVRETDTVARMGGDEFTVLLNDVSDPEDVAVIARKIVEQFAVPFTAGGRELHTTTSIGIAMFPDDGSDVDTLLKHADSAMYRAKARGRDSFEFYTADLSMRAQARLSVESALRQAVDRHGLDLHYQPKIDLLSGSVVGLEALARWPHRKFGMIMPNVFIPVAEETGLILAIGKWVLRAAGQQAQAWRAEGLPVQRMAVNVSGRQFALAEYPREVAEILGETGLEPAVLELEITESVVMANEVWAEKAIKELKALGISLAIDDFGTGDSSFGRLRHFEVDRLKIDRSFVTSITDHGDDRAIAAAIIAMSRSMHINVTAEGVEN